MLTAPRQYFYAVALFLLVAVMTQQVVGWGWLSDVDKEASKLARRIDTPRGLFTVTVTLGLRGLILTVCVPWLLWLSRQRRSWTPIVGFVLVLLFETGLVGALKMSVGRTFPYHHRYVENMMIDVGGLAFPSGHAANAVALWGFMAWFLTLERREWRPVAYMMTTSVALIVGVSSWLIDTHWITDILTGFALGGIALLATTGLLNALGLSSVATTQREQEVRL
jgi:membrane-associated phospholipid phosphatase